LDNILWLRMSYINAIQPHYKQHSNMYLLRQV
jgi:hypothetical protein